MRSLSLYAALSVALSFACLSCSRAALAGFVPKLDLRCVVAVRASEGRDEKVAASFGAWLRFQSTAEARALPTSYEASSLVGTLPCVDDDEECLRELFEAEASVAAALREEP